MSLLPETLHDPVHQVLSGSPPIQGGDCQLRQAPRDVQEADPEPRTSPDVRRHRPRQRGRDHPVPRRHVPDAVPGLRRRRRRQMLQGRLPEVLLLRQGRLQGLVAAGGRAGQDRRPPRGQDDAVPVRGPHDSPGLRTLAQDPPHQDRRESSEGVRDLAEAEELVDVFGEVLQ